MTFVIFICELKQVCLTRFIQAFLADMWSLIEAVEKVYLFEVKLEYTE